MGDWVRQDLLSCFDRIVITGMLPGIGHAEAMARYLSGREIRLFDYPRWAEPRREELRDPCRAGLAPEASLEIEFIRNYKAFRKEERIKAILASRGEHPGLVHNLLGDGGLYPSYRPWHDKPQHTTRLKSTPGKCQPRAQRLTQALAVRFTRGTVIFTSSPRKNVFYSIRTSRRCLTAKAIAGNEADGISVAHL